MSGSRRGGQASRGASRGDSVAGLATGCMAGAEESLAASANQELMAVEGVQMGREGLREAALTFQALRSW